MKYNKQFQYGDYVLYTLYKNISYVCKFLAYNEKNHLCKISLPSDLDDIVNELDTATDDTAQFGITYIEVEEEYLKPYHS